ncbi:MAG: hypothetical protein IKG79_06485 [Neisseriaceae bacterium]|nr:hypothetical protein [Neisseriaceae bacterium]
MGAVYQPRICGYCGVWYRCVFDFSGSLKIYLEIFIMTRDEQRKLKALKSALPKMLKEFAPKYKLKKIDYMLYAVKNDLFFDCLIDVSVNKNNECICSTRESLKPIWIDDLFWQLLGMHDNMKAPISLRANGAFTVSGVFIYENEQVLDFWNENELRNIVKIHIEHFCNNINKMTIQDFENNLSQPYHYQVRKALYHIHQQQFQQALDTVGNDRGSFRNGNIDINNAIRNYCIEQMNI